MASSVYIGLAVGAIYNGYLSTATFDNVALTGNVNPVPTYNALAATTNLLVSPNSATGFSLAWDAVARATSYAVDRSADGVSFAQVGTTALTSYNDANQAGTLRYFYRVAALDGGPNRSVPSASASTVNRPSAVTNLSVQSWTNTNLIINWRNTDNETGYRLERSTDGTNYTLVTTLRRTFVHTRTMA